jgi:hypothetical protein
MIVAISEHYRESARQDTDSVITTKCGGGGGNRRTLMVESTTAELAWARRGVTLSAMASASRESSGVYLDRAWRMNT